VEEIMMEHVDDQAAVDAIAEIFVSIGTQI
jgi:hypothetical protein